MSTGNEDDGETQKYATHLTEGFVLPMVLRATIELGVFEILAGADVVSLSGAEIAAELPTTNPTAGEMVDRMLRLLAGFSIVTCSLRRGGKVERLYGLTPVSKLLLKNDDGFSLTSASLLTTDKVVMESWYRLKDAVLEGGVPFEKAHGMNLYEYTKSDERFGNVFNDSMSNHSTASMDKIVEMYKGFEGIETLVDVGGGNGTLLSMIVAKYPEINKAINFDMPHVIQNAPTYPGVENVGGDMFSSVPSGDAIVMKAILHNWSDEKCLKVLRNCYDAVTEKGKLIVIELIVPEETTSKIPEWKRLVHFDVAMLVHLPSGKERTANEYKALADAAGFKGFRVSCSEIQPNIMEFLKYKNNTCL